MQHTKEEIISTTIKVDKWKNRLWLCISAYAIYAGGLIYVPLLFILFFVMTVVVRFGVLAAFNITSVEQFKSLPNTGSESAEIPGVFESSILAVSENIIGQYDGIDIPEWIDVRISATQILRFEYYGISPDGSMPEVDEPRAFSIFSNIVFSAKLK